MTVFRKVCCSVRRNLIQKRQDVPLTLSYELKISHTVWQRPYAPYPNTPSGRVFEPETLVFVAHEHIIHYPHWLQTC